uniref:Uncharacterized protein n=1 Tax=Octopus bimaculoides TaxID=37653 RepID=A0A0L8I804_OCTBM
MQILQHNTSFSLSFKWKKNRCAEKLDEQMRAVVVFSSNNSSDHMWIVSWHKIRNR